MARLERDPTPALWPPPRGPRNTFTGEWRWAWGARPVSSFSDKDDEAEAEVEQAWRALVHALIAERYARDWGLRRLAREAGVSFSVVTDLEAGNTWPRVGTVQAVAGALGFALEVKDEPGLPVTEGLLRQVDRQVRKDRMSHRWVAEAMGVPPARERFSRRRVAEEAGVRPNTLYELPQAVAGGSVRTLLVLARQASTKVVLVTTRRPDGRASVSAGQ